jgi:phosphoglycolate phosphatase-like HAD superfamily hydrolase
MLILFDIDATLLTSSKAGVLALERGGKDAFGDRFSIDGVDFAGRLDPLIIADLLRQNRLDHTTENAERLKAGYIRNLPEYLARPGSTTTCPGVHPLLDELRRHGHITLGLLTGNFAETGALKLRSVGIDPAWFPVHVWGDQSPHNPPARDHLPPLGLARFEQLHGRPAEPDRTVIIGDTPHDIRCAKVNGCKSLGVATGQFSLDQLRAHDPSHVLADLSETRAVLGWLLEAVGASRGFSAEATPR